MSDSWSYKVFLDYAGGNGEDPERLDFHTNAVAAPPNVPNGKEGPPEEKGARGILKTVKSLKKVNVQVPSGVSDVVHVFLDAQQNHRPFEVWVSLAAKDERGVEASRDTVTLSGVKVLSFVPISGGKYTASLEGTSARHYLYTPGDVTREVDT